MQISPKSPQQRIFGHPVGKHALLAKLAALHPGRVGYDYSMTAVGKTANVTVLTGNSDVPFAQQVLAGAEAAFQQTQALFGIQLPPVVLLIAPLSPGGDGTGGREL